MIGYGCVTLVARCSEPSTGRDVVRLETDWPHPDRAVYIDPGDVPEVGTVIKWTSGHVEWRDEGVTHRVRKVGYSFDPYPPFADGMQQI